MCRVIEEMRNQSLREGIQQGIQQGARESAIAATLRMLADGSISVEKIAEFVGLSPEEIMKIKATHDT